MVKPCETTRQTLLAVRLAETGGPVVATHSSGGGYLVEEDTMTEGVGQVELITWVNPFLNVGTDGRIL